MTTPETLRAAATAIRRDGWTQFERHDLRGRVCALGAIERAFGFRNYTNQGAEKLAPDALSALCVAIGVKTPPPLFQPGEIAQWNNADDQTAENVAQAFDLAAVLVEAAPAAAAPETAHAEQLVPR